MKIFAKKPYTRFLDIPGSPKPYRIDKTLVSFYFLCMVLSVLIIIGVVYNFDTTKKIYVHCPNDSIPFLGGCENPLFLEYPLCSMVSEEFCQTRILPLGYSYGSPPPKILSWFPIIFIGGLIGVFILNHFKYNCGVKLEWQESE